MTYINNHLSKEGIEIIQGTYRGNMQVTHYYDPATGLNVMLDKDKNLVGAWKLNDKQLKSLRGIGNVR